MTDEVATDLGGGLVYAIVELAADGIAPLAELCSELTQLACNLGKLIGTEEEECNYTHH